MNKKNDPAWVIESRLQAICEEALIEWDVRATVTVDVTLVDEGLEEHEVCEHGDSY